MNRVIESQRGTAVFVAFRTPQLDLSGIPSDVPVIVVHNDDSLQADAISRDVEHMHCERNIGFGAAVNRALPLVRTPRLVLINPDVDLDLEGWRALERAPIGSVATLRLALPDGKPTSVVAPYPGPLALTLTAWRVGRLLPLSIRRHIPRALAGRWISGQNRQLDASGVDLPLTDWWVSGATMSLDTERMRSVCGFDEGYFMYLEDADLCARLAAAHPDMTAHIAPASATHQVGASSRDPRVAAEVERHRAGSCLRYAARFGGLSGKLARLAVRLRTVTL